MFKSLKKRSANSDSHSRSFRFSRQSNGKKKEKQENSTGTPKKLKSPASSHDSIEGIVKTATASSDSAGVVPNIGPTIEVLTALSDCIAEFIIRNEPHEAPLSSGASTDTKEASLAAMNEGFENIVAKADALTEALAHFADQDYARSDKQLNKTFQRLIDKERYDHFSERLTKELVSSGVDLKIQLKPNVPANRDALAHWDEQIKEEHESTADLVRITKFKYLLRVAFRQFTPFGA